MRDRPAPHLEARLARVARTVPAALRRVGLGPLPASPARAGRPRVAGDVAAVAGRGPAADRPNESPGKADAGNGPLLATLARALAAKSRTMSRAGSSAVMVSTLWPACQ